MKKIFPFIVLFLVIGGIIASIMYITMERIPIDDTKRLYINCDGKNEKYDLYLNDKITAFKGNDKCEIILNVRNIERNIIKLNSNRNVYYVNPEGKIDETGTYHDIVVESNTKVIVYGTDKTTKLIFQYK